MFTIYIFQDKSVCLPTQLGRLEAVFPASEQGALASLFHDFESSKYVILLSLFLGLLLK